MSQTNIRHVRVGTRRSQLALVQTNLATSLLQDKNPDLTFEVVPINTCGDKILDMALSKIGDKSLFTKELEEKLLSKDIDFVVHSLKDVPTILPEGLVLGCIFDRVCPNDVLLASPINRGKTLKDMQKGAKIGTSALRRIAVLKSQYPELDFVNIRGNLNTRIAKLDGEFAYQSGKEVTQYDGIILAEAGVKRLNWSHRIDETFNQDPYAVSQGALACECRQDDLEILTILSSIHCETSALTSLAERSLMRTLDGGCSTPIAVRCEPEPGTALSGKLNFLALTASVLSLDGTRNIEAGLALNLPFSLAGSKRRAQGDAEPESSSSQSVFQVKRIKYEGSLDLLKETPKSEAVNDARAVFLGLNVQPMCDIARLRLARACLLGDKVARKLLDNGAGEILKETKSSALNSGRLNPAEVSSLASAYKSSSSLSTQSTSKISTPSPSD